MKKQFFVLVALIVAIALQSGCGIISKVLNASDGSDNDTPVVGILADETGCYSGPGTNYEAARFLEANQHFSVLGIDDDVTWIDDDVTWIQINPNALVDPEPPHSPINELSPQPDPPGSVKVVRCWVPDSSVQVIGDIAGAKVILKPILWIVKHTDCFSGPGFDYQVLKAMNLDLHFDILGIDDDVTWIDDDVTWIDDDVTWFQINPNAIIDPDPPHRPLNEQSGSSSVEMAVRCWVPRERIQFSGDLTRLPVIVVPGVTVPLQPPTAEPVAQPPAEQPPSSPPTVDCGAYTTYQTCMQHSNFGCDWEPKRGVCIKR